MIEQILAWYAANLAHGLAHLSEPSGKTQVAVFLALPIAVIAALIYAARGLTWLAADTASGGELADARTHREYGPPRLSDRQ